ncbi:MAG: metallophosphoesterase family protein [Acutalibacteraceae bacterium]|jgi:calcineurin-like phosphoesterase family protein
MYDELYALSRARAKQKIWVMSDLQQRDPAKARECLDVSMADFFAMDHPADMIWYLGDAVEGQDLGHTEAMAAMQEEAFASTGLPLCFVMGNHDLEYAWDVQKPGDALRFPFHERVRRHPGWHTTARYTDWYFRLEVGEYAVYFLSDHMDAGHRWAFIHGTVWGDESAYPDPDAADRLRERMAADPRPVITVSHYGYHGGNRASERQSRLFPLPKNVRLHLYGHAHIGDFAWAGADAWRRISWVNWHDIPQIEVSSFEHIRGQTCRSVFLHIYEDGGFGVFFRDHDHRRFTEAYFPSTVRYPSKFETP